MTIITRVAQLLRTRPPAPDDERAVAIRLGYLPRADHPWRHPALNHTRAPVVEPAGARGERSHMFEVSRDFSP